MTLWGCSSDIERGINYVQADPPPTTAASPSFTLPTGSDVQYSQYASTPNRSVGYDHSGTSLYSAVTTVFLSTNGGDLDFKRNRSFEEGWYYTEAVINKGTFTAPNSGRFGVRAVYRTHNPSAFQNPQDVQGFRERTGEQYFQVCSDATTRCSPGGRAAPSGTPGDAPSASRAAPQEEPAELTQYCGPEGDQCDPGGGGGGGTPTPPHLRFRTHTAAMGPFFSSSTVGSSASRGEIEEILENLNPEQLDGIADIIEEAYGESIYDALHVPEGAVATASRRATSASDDSPFLALLAPLAVADRSALGVERIYLDRLLQSRDRYRAARAAQPSVGSTPAVVSGPAPGLGDANRTGGASAGVSAAMWPNPTSSRLNIRVPAGHGSAVTIYDVLGRLVAQIPVAAGSREQVVTWNLRTGRGPRVAAGVYQVVLNSAGARHATTVTVR